IPHRLRSEKAICHRGALSAKLIVAYRPLNAERGSLMVFRPAVRANWAVIVASTCVVALATPTYAQQSAASNLSDAAFQVILACLASGREIVITSKSSCEPYGTGSSFAKNMPIGARDGTWRDVCQRKEDPRNLPVDIVKRIVAQKGAVIAPTGI